MSLLLTTAQGCFLKKTGNGLIKALRQGGHLEEAFDIRRDNGDIVASVEKSDSPNWEVSIGGVFVRNCTKDLVVQTARLYVDAQRLRKTLKIAERMIIRPV